MSATTPRSWVTRITAAPVSSRSSRMRCEDLRLDRHVERRRRLVGDQHATGRTTAPSRSSRAGACRPRTRAGRCRTRSRARGIPTRSSSSTARSRACCVGQRPRAPGSARRSASPIRWTGFSEVIGSWKIIAISAPRTRRSSSSRRADQLGALVVSRSPRSGRWASGSAPSASSRSPTCRSPTRPPPPAPRRPRASNETPSTACTTPSSVANETCRSRRRSSSGVAPTCSLEPDPRVEVRRRRCPRSRSAAR